MQNFNIVEKIKNLKPLKIAEYEEGVSRVNSKIINMATWEAPLDKRLAQFFDKSREITKGGFYESGQRN
ncbi:MAG: hypothetical protein LBD62_04765 [Candidatus Margulisbacteria bacterium]|jgi:hypothetical protein|nr:hypothetical protein [Candidatus Margulisiibacteriota bacterium]